MAEHVTHSRAEPAHEHHSSASYWIIWAVLLVLTALTVWTGRMDLPNFGLILALIIATTKAVLVLLFFMHLWEQKGVNRVTFVATMVFVVVLILGVFGDMTTRLSVSLPQREQPPAHRNLELPPTPGQPGH